MKKDRIYRGVVPSEKDGWERVEKFECGDGIRWLVFRQAQPHSDEWVTLKMVAEDGAPKKASYWLTLNERTGQFGFARDYAMMREHRPSAHAKFEAVILSLQGKM